jgi:myo-inositol-1(or 4)-monophosphatase
LDLQRYYDFAVETAYLAGRLTLGYFQGGVTAGYKPDDTPVTAADRGAEELIRQRIEMAFPDHDILGEEFGLLDRQKPFRWLIDPIDGTKSFMRGVPLYGVLLGLEIEGEVKVGACYFPALGEMVSAAEGLGCWWNGRRCRVSDVEHLDRAWVSCTDVYHFEKYGRGQVWERICQKAYVRTVWGDCYGYALVATGRCELMLDPVMNVWDCAPFPVILKEAGGYFGDWAGEGSIYKNEAIGTTQTLLPEILALIKGDTF